MKILLYRILSSIVKQGGRYLPVKAIGVRVLKKFNIKPFFVIVERLDHKSIKILKLSVELEVCNKKLYQMMEENKKLSLEIAELNAQNQIFLSEKINVERELLNMTNIVMRNNEFEKLMKENEFLEKKSSKERGELQQIKKEKEKLANEFATLKERFQAMLLENEKHQAESQLPMLIEKSHRKAFIKQETSASRSCFPKRKRTRAMSVDKATMTLDIESRKENEIYCKCKQPFFGKMILCDNAQCSGWFHFNCVNVKQTPKGNWYCPECHMIYAKKQRSTNSL